MTPSAIRTARKRLGLSYDEFADALCLKGKNRSITIWRWERGDRKPSEQNLALIKQLLKTL
jgi:DNA-binding transcriptional regulator YiaG